MDGVTASARAGGDPPTEVAGSALSAFAAAALELVDGSPPDGALRELARAVALGTGAELVVARLAEDGRLVARAVHADSPALTAELEATRIPLAEIGEGELELADAPSDPRAPGAVRRAAVRAGMPIVRFVPVSAGGEIVAALELYRSGLAFGPEEQALARAAAAHLALAARIRGPAGADGDGRAGLTAAHLEHLGEALAAGADETDTAEQVVRVASETTGADGATLWHLDADGPPALLAASGFEGPVPEALGAPDGVRQAVAANGGAPLRLGEWLVHTVPLGEPPTAVLQLAFAGDGPETSELARLAPFVARAALALRRSRRVGLIALALRRSQTLVAVVSQAIAQLSLAHTLETAVERVAELTSSANVAVYLREDGRLVPAASRGLAGPHTDLAERLLELALGPYRSRGFLFVQDMRSDGRLAGLEHVLEESAIRRALFIPLLVHDEVIGALAVFRSRPLPYREGEEGLLIALSSQLAVAVQNARLHERTKELSAILERTLDSERRSARQLRGLYAISQSFAESLSLERLLDAVARTMVELLDADAAVIRMPDARGEALVARAVHVAEAPAREVVTRLVSRPQPMSAPLARRLLLAKRGVVLRAGATTTDDAHHVLEPFFRQGGTAAVLPLATPAEDLGTLTLVCLDPRRPLEQDAVDAALAVTAQAALAIDNGRLYQQQKDFAETMQRSLLPHELPDVPGLEIGHVYQSAAQVDVGGDLYDFVVLEDGRLAVAVGDVLGKGIGAAADMAMTKFSFRVLARGASEPSSVLASANDVVCEEIEPGKFVTLVYALVDARAGEVSCASAGHLPARVVDPSGRVTTVGKPGLALGVEPAQRYPAERVRVAPGSAVVLFTDGVLESRRDGELYGEERLERFLAANRHLPAQELAEAILADCRAFGGGELADDCAIVCLKLAR
ncbi:MAG TPA: SpoIIE family protein phosphatase [Gaiellaceae bacterium]|nr:SpoIIE family protein phosphatase [Gaiellaceae bacterium]